MRIGVPTERPVPASGSSPRPRRRSAQLVGLGYDVVVERGAGDARASPTRRTRRRARASATRRRRGRADVVTTVNRAVGRAGRGADARAPTLIAMLAPAAHARRSSRACTRAASRRWRSTPCRASRAPSRSTCCRTMSNVAGYRAVIEAAEEYGGMFTGQVTAAGKTAAGDRVRDRRRRRRSGGDRRGRRAWARRCARSTCGPRSASRSSRWAPRSSQAAAAQQEVSTDGYASALTERAGARSPRRCTPTETRQGRHRHHHRAGARARRRRTITAEMVAGDAAGQRDRRPRGVGRRQLRAHGARASASSPTTASTIIGYTDLTSRMPKHTSQLFGTNIVNLLKLLTPGKDGQLVLDLDDVVQRGMTVTHAGEVLWPPPPGAGLRRARPRSPGRRPRSRRAGRGRRARGQAPRAAAPVGRARALAAVLVALGDHVLAAAFLGHFTVFVLAVIVGYYVISNVSHSLHTPLMAQTNAISGIILVGALLQIGDDELAGHRRSRSSRRPSPPSTSSVGSSSPTA